MDRPRTDRELAVERHCRNAAATDSATRRRRRACGLGKEGVVVMALRILCAGLGFAACGFGVIGCGLGDLGDVVWYCLRIPIRIAKISNLSLQRPTRPLASGVAAQVGWLGIGRRCPRSKRALVAVAKATASNRPAGLASNRPAGVFLQS